MSYSWFNVLNNFLCYRDNKKIPCVPKTGRILVFEHKLIHEGSKLISGRNYTIRSDVMYTWLLIVYLSISNKGSVFSKRQYTKWFNHGGILPLGP